MAEVSRHLSNLIRIDTSNPPGGETAAARYIHDQLDFPGVDRIILERTMGRGNVIVRVRGDGSAPPFLILSHLDVVAARELSWTYPPFSGTVAEGYIWGRGAVDMKYLAAQAISLIQLICREHLSLKGDLVFAGTADEEEASEQGLAWLVKEHSDLLRAEHAITELGGFTMHLLGRRFIPIQVAEKGSCRIKLQPGEGAPGRRAGTNGVSAVGRLLRHLECSRLPFHLVPLVRDFLSTIMIEVSPLPLPAGTTSLVRFSPVNKLLFKYGIPAELHPALLSLFQNTVTPTIVRARRNNDQQDDQAVIYLDGRVLPGFTPADLQRELACLFAPFPGTIVTMEKGENPVEFSRNTLLYKAIESVIEELDPAAVPLPMLTIGSTDARFLASIPITTYGFIPMDIPADLPFSRLFHGVDERVPLTSLGYGFKMLLRLIEKMVM